MPRTDLEFRPPSTLWQNLGCDNFSTVGVGIKSEWEGKIVFKSGTSFATPIAAGIAANILEFARTHLTDEMDNLSDLYSYKGMRSFLRAMARSNDMSPFRFILPGNVFRVVETDDPAELKKAWNEVSKQLRHFLLTGIVPQEWEPRSRHAV